MKIRANGVQLEVEVSGDLTDARGRARPAVLLIMGLGMQLTAWPPALVQALVDAGYCVVRFDNRDAGLSGQLDHLGVPNLLMESLKYKFGWRLKPPYTVHDMAQDAVALLDALGIARAHVVGVSMGGMIAQRMALAAPARTASLVSIMSTSSARRLPGPAPAVTRALLSRPANRTEDAVIDHTVRLFSLIGSPGFAISQNELRAQVTAATRRAYTPRGTARQMVAVVADGKRSQELERVAAPTLVIHGTADPLIPLACGQDTARRIPGATFLAIDGLGHDLPTGVVPQLVAAILPHLSRADNRSATA